MYITESNGMNLLLAGGASVPTWFAVMQDASSMSFFYGIVTSVLLLILGKLMDLGIRVLMDRTKRRGDGKTSNKTEGGPSDRRDV